MLFQPPQSLGVDTDLCERIELPCGKCLACQQNKSNKWTTRIMAESFYYGQSLFLTLTYNDESIPCNKYGDYTLLKRDVQLFLKRLRKKYPLYDIRYYCAGEYGEKTLRPHYHMILFGFMPNDLRLYKRGKNPLYISDILTNTWKNGHVVVGICTPQSIAYTAKYSTKQQDYALANEVEKPFRLTSRRPAIGLRFFEEYYKNIFSLCAVHLNGQRRSIPEYYKRKMREFDEDMYDTFKIKMRKYVEQLKLVEDNKDLDDIYNEEDMKLAYSVQLDEHQRKKRFL